MRSRNSIAGPAWRDASMSASSQAVEVFSEITSALTSSRRICLRSAAYVASLRISVRSLIKSPPTNSARSSAAPFSNSTLSSRAKVFASVVAVASRASGSSPRPTSTTSARSSRSLPSFMRWSRDFASSTSAVNGAGFSRYAVIASTVASRFFSPSFSIRSRSSMKMTCCCASIGNICACSSACCVSPRSAENRDTPHMREPSGTNFSIKSARHASRKYGSSPSSRIAGINFPLCSCARNFCCDILAIKRPRKMEIRSWKLETPNSVILDDRGDQSLCKVLRHAIQGRILLTEKARYIRGDFVLAPEYEIIRMIQNLVVRCLRQRHFTLHLHQHRRRASAGRSKEQRHGFERQHFALQHRIPARRFRHNFVRRSREEFVDRRRRQSLLDAIRRGRILQRGYRDDVDFRGQRTRPSCNGIAATSHAERKNGEQNQGEQGQAPLRQ